MLPNVADGQRTGRGTKVILARKIVPMETLASQGQQDALEPVLVPSWEEYPWLIHGFSTRAGGVSRVYSDGRGELNLGYTREDDPAAVASNRARWVGHLAGDAAGVGLVTARQVHSATVLRVGRRDLQEPTALEGDGLITDEPGVLLGIGTADCVPVLLVDPEHRAVGAVHAGWRGTVAGIVARAVEQMDEAFGSRPEAMLAVIGPAIGACCYTVGEEVHEQFRAAFPYGSELFTDNLRLDLSQANRRQLLGAGLLEAGIAMAGECTQCHPERFFSYRGEKGVTGRMMAIVGVRPD